MRKWLAALTERYRSDADFKTRVILYRGALINVAFAFYKLVSGLLYRSYWMIAIAVYYLALVAIKSILILNDRKTAGLPEKDRLMREWTAYRSAGLWLLALGAALSGIILQVIRQGKGWSYPMHLIYMIALFAFYRIPVAIIRLTHTKHEENPIFSAAKIIDLIFAVAALFTLQTAMLEQFGGGKGQYVTVFNALTGAGAMLLIVGTALLMILRSGKKIRELDEK